MNIERSFSPLFRLWCVATALLWNRTLGEMKIMTRAVVSFMKQQVQVFTREKVQSFLLDHHVNEFTLKEMLGEEVSSEKSSQGSSSYQSFQSFRKAQKEKEKEKDKEGTNMSSSGLITVLWCVSSTNNIVADWRRRNRGGVAQMVERSLSMREVRGSMPLSSTFIFASQANNVWGRSDL